ncbi:CDK-activating kinase assembly factor [Microthyrium microscopicum]|uniref:RNA polymerase II transcription factor B subunit 3 n=1 Tax=Microthyrium microscopicum TaxID=703497 RepID=A0A6A6UDG9_9PEZI|nr:CDK-activating kinase assembly factor [Microthyrium microscopicum]
MSRTASAPDEASEPILSLAHISLNSLPDPMDEECPICHSKRYLRRDMTFLLNPTCYHKMCSSCVERLFASGPAPCPVAGCSKVLRRARFRIPTFADLRMEREIDIRREVASVFNRRADDFESLRGYNDYLNDVEDITYVLIEGKGGKEEKEARKKLEGYRVANEGSIKENRKLEEAERQRSAKLALAERARINQAEHAALAAAEAERREKELARAGIINALAAGGDAMGIVREGARALNRRPGARANTVDVFNEDAMDTGFTIAGLRKPGVKAAPEAPYDPFRGYPEDTGYEGIMGYAFMGDAGAQGFAGAQGLTGNMDYVTMPDTSRDSDGRIDGKVLWDDWLWKLKKETAFSVGGYKVEEFYKRALVEAFSGLGVFVGEEKEKKDSKRRKKTEPVKTEEQGNVAVKVEG